MLVITLLLVFFEAVVSYSCSSDTACVFVDNQCPFTLYLQRTTIDGNENFPTTVKTLASNNQTVLDIAGWSDGPGARLYAWWQYPIGQNWTEDDTLKYRDKVEINWCFTKPNTMCYNPTAVDYFALPVKIGPYNESDCPTVPMTGQYNIKVNNIKSDCPTQYVETPPAGTCLAPRSICMNNETKTDALCSHLDPILQTCVEDGVCSEGVTSTHVYACSESLAGNPPLCAALNRGVYGTWPDTDTSLFYQTSPYNEYAKYIHEGGNSYGLEYAFPYDDYGSESSGYEVCTTNFMSVTFCPGSLETSTTTPPDVTTTDNPTKGPTKEPTVGTTSITETITTAPMNKCQDVNTNKYDGKDMMIAICVSFASGVMITVVLMLIYKYCMQRRKTLNEQLLGSTIN